MIAMYIRLHSAAATNLKNAEKSTGIVLFVVEMGHKSFNKRVINCRKSLPLNRRERVPQIQNAEKTWLIQIDQRKT